MTASPSDFAHILRSFRLRAGLSQEELAERAGVSARAVSDMERGLRKSPRPETLRLVAHALDLTNDERVRLFASSHPESEGLARSSQRGAPGSSKTSTAIPLAIRPLPRPLDALIGRENEVAAIASLGSDQIRLVTLTGPGGVGKTRLCLAVAAQLQSRFAEGAAFVDLAPLSEPEQVAPAISAALGLTADAYMVPGEVLLAALRERSVLLVLDNFEHLLGAAPLISELLVSCPSLNILATSRVRLRLRGEHVFSVQPLPVPEDAEAISPDDLSSNPSVRLFVERAREAHYGFDLNDQNVAAVADICGRLDGLPLAIELAASRVGTMSPGALQARLQHRLPTLTGGPRDAPARQQTLRDAIAWSYDLLDPAEQNVFRGLAVFVGGFTLDAADSVVGEPEVDTAAVIERLAECSLLSRMDVEPDESRWTMLDTIREYAATLLEESGDLQIARRRHADWSIQLAAIAGADLLVCRNEFAWYRKLDTEMANTRTAIEFMLESDDGAGALRLIGNAASYWTDRPYLRELLPWVGCALTRSSEPFSDEAVLAMSLVPLATAMLGDFETASIEADRVLGLAQSVGSPLVLGYAYYVQGAVAEFSHQTERAIQSYEQSLEHCRAAGYLSQILMPLFEVGARKMQAGSLEEAGAILDEGLAMARQAGAEVALPFGLVCRGFVALAQDEPRSAAHHFAEGMGLAGRLRMDRILLGLLGGISGVAVAIGQPETAARLQGAMEAARRSSGVDRISEAASVEVIQRATREQLGFDAYEALLLEGQDMSYDEAIASAYRIAGDAEQRSTGANHSL
jgi:predicted ATPase/transcriptional regulator with XRE-family HTH domain